MDMKVGDKFHRVRSPVWKNVFQVSKSTLQIYKNTRTQGINIRKKTLYTARPAGFFPALSSFFKENGGYNTLIC